MKKLIALALAALLVCALPVMAFAEPNTNLSPSAPKAVNVTVQRGSISGTNNHSTTTDGQGTVTVSVDPKAGAFNGWSIYKPVNGQTQQAAIGTKTAETKYVNAVAGTDYIIVSGSLTSTTLTVRPLTDIVICGNYDGKITDPQTGNDSGSTAPKTGANTAILVVIAALALAGAGYATKKVLA